MFSKLVLFLLSQIFLPPSRFGQLILPNRKVKINGKQTSALTFCENLWSTMNGKLDIRTAVMVFLQLVYYYSIFVDSKYNCHCGAQLI